MSIAISTSSAAAPSLDGPAAASSGTSSGSESAVPFDAMLDDQTEACDDQAEAADDVSQNVCDPAAQQAATPPAGKSQAAPELCLAVLGAYVHGARGFLDIAAEVARALAAAKATGRDTAAGDANGPVLSLLAPVEQQRPLLRLAGLVPEGAESSSVNLPIPSEIERRLLQMFMSDDSSAQTPVAAEQDDTRSGIADPWGKTVSESAQTGSSPLDAATFRQGPPPAVAALVEAIRLANHAGASADTDSGFQQQTMTMGFDRGDAKGARVIHLVQPAGTFEATLGNTQPSSVAPSSPALPNEANVVSSIVQSMHLQMRDGVGTAVVHLEPDYLGAVTIGLRVEGGAVTATLHADNPQVRAWMEANEPMLRQGLSAQGLSLDRLLISDERIPQDRPADRQYQHYQQQEPPPRHKPRRSDSGTFEVVV